MSTKRKYNLDEDDDNNLQDIHVSNKKHTLDSDEEDSDEYEKDYLGDSDIEGEEDGVSKVQDEVKITPFNMREELEEGHFDKEGHYHWNKSNDIKDNWLDNIDWVKIQNEKETSKKGDTNDAVDVKSMNVYNEALMYKQLLSYMMDGETVACALKRLGKNRVKMSSVERLRLKKKGIRDENGDKITKLTELANEILTKTGNMDIYEATYESIKEKVNCTPSTSKDGGLLTESNFDMYSDDFNKNEKEQLKNQNCKNDSEEKKVTDSKPKELLWEFKWNENDNTLQGPFNTKQMLKWSNDGYLKNGVYVRKVGEQTNFYTSNRIDFDLYL
ncbi:CD2 antigen cytoplasmic tail-binding protein 2 homolog [Lucilia sericata]|uniref:CD2 antigen cytoplasmic tail-binding protein 2 homolog n=1 Tax=Lucilia sericata TaxID=13632 RepID=UPI0018A835DA|nr:CD2 antigen cytoplasmic tail-binding protein 2 homolog [Lucilia sericata]